MKKWKVLVCLMLVLAMAAGSASAVTLKKGSGGYDTYFLQKRLNRLGYDTVQADGSYGSETVAAVKQFQQERGIKASGSVNKETWAALFDDAYRLQFSLGLNARNYTVYGKLAAPYTYVEVIDNPYGFDYSAEMRLDNLNCRVVLTEKESLDALCQEIDGELKKAYDEQFVSQLEGKKYKKSAETKYKINGKPARVWSVTWDFNNGDAVTHYSYCGAVELDQVEGRQMMAFVMAGYNLVKADAGLVKHLGTNAMKEVLAGLRCGRDRLTEYQEGAAKRKKASKLKGKIQIPDFMPVEENQQDTLDILYEIRDWVDPAADGTGETVDGPACVSLYYGVKIMQRYMYMADAGNKKSDCMTESAMSLANGVFDSQLKKDFPQVREKLTAALTAARLALTDRGAPYLTLMGLEKPRWTAEELDEMTSKLTGVLDRAIGQ